MINEEFNPLTIGKLLDRAFRLTMGSLRRHIKTHLIFGGLFTALTVIFIAAMAMIGLTSGGAGALDEEIIIRIVMGLYLLILLPISLFWYIMVYDMLIKGTLGKEWHFNDSFSLARRNFWKVTLCGLLSTLILAAGTLFFLVGYFGALAFLVSVMPAILYEKRGIGSSIKRSFKLTSYSFWSVAGTVMLYLLISFGINMVFNIIKSVPVFMIYRFTLSLSLLFYIVSGILNFIQIIVMLLVYILGSALFTGIYFNQRLKYENFGTELMAENMVAELNGEGGDEPPPHYR